MRGGRREGAEPLTLLRHERYEAGERLGAGGQGVVVRVRDRLRPGRALVAKVWKAGAFDEELLRGEFALLSRLLVPGLVRAHDLGRDEASGAPFLVEDFVDGPEAEAWVWAAPSALERGRRLGGLLGQVACTLASLHDAGVLHGDLKPPHVRLSADGPVLLDLGAAVERRGGARPRALSVPFAAPEVRAGAPLSVAAEVYGLGALAWALAARRPPPGDLRRLRALSPWVPPSLADLIESMLAAHPAERPRDARQVAWALGAKGMLGAPWAPPRGREAVLAALAGPWPGRVRYLAGPSGLGKSFLARELVASLLLSGRPAYLWKFPSDEGREAARLVALLRGAAAPPAGEEPLLVLDDIEQAPGEVRAAVEAFRCRPSSGPAARVLAVGRGEPAGAGDVVRLGPLDDEAMAELGRRCGVDEGALGERVRAAGGSPGFLLASEGRAALLPEAALARASALRAGERRLLAALAALGGEASAAWGEALLGEGFGEACAGLLVEGLIVRRERSSGEAWALGAPRLAAQLVQALGGEAPLAEAASLLLDGAEPKASAVGPGAAPTKGERQETPAGGEASAPQLLALAEAGAPRRDELLARAASVARREGLRELEIRALSALCAAVESRTGERLRRLERLVRDAGAALAHPEVLGWLEEAAGRDPRLAPLALRRRAEALAREGKRAEAEAACRKAAEEARRLGSGHDEAFALATLGACALFVPDWDRAYQALREARERLASVEAAEDVEEVARLDHNFGVVAVYRGEIAAAVEAFRSALAVKARLGDRAGMRACLRNLGYALTRAGQLDEAARALDEALALATSLGQETGKAWCLAARAEVEVRRGRTAEAERLVAEAEALGERVPGPVAADLLLLRSEIALLEGDGPAALARLGSLSGELRSSDPLVDGRARALEARALLALRPPDRRRAARLALDAIRRARKAALPEAEQLATAALREARPLRGFLAAPSRCREQPDARPPPAGVPPRPHLVGWGRPVALAPPAGDSGRTLSLSAADPRTSAADASAAAAGERAEAAPVPPASTEAEGRRAAADNGGCGQNPPLAAQGPPGDPTQRGGGAEEPPQGVWEWIEALAAGVGPEEARRSLGLLLLRWSGAERIFFADLGADGVPEQVRAFDLDGLELGDAARRLPPDLLGAVVGRGAPVHQRSVETAGGRGARVGFAGTPRSVVLLEHRFAEGRFDHLDPVTLRRWGALLGLLARGLGPASLWSSSPPAPGSSPPLRASPSAPEPGATTLPPAARPRRVFPLIEGESEALRRALVSLDLALDSDLPVLIVGETGTGKELFARALHEQGPRSKFPFVAINCAAVPESLFEAELFGHARGSFTGADRARAGLFAAADRGTLFLDEIGELAAHRQASLLRVLETRRYRPVGSDEERPALARLVAATNRDLGADVAAGRFRSDLLFRLDVLSIRVPPLRERKGDVARLAQSFLARAGVRASFGPGVEEALDAYRWPGNVRELEHLMQRLSAYRLDQIELAHLPRELRPRRSPQASAPAAPPRRPRPDDERSEVQRALDQCGGNISHAARLLGLTRHGLKKRMTRLGMRASDGSQSDKS